MRESAEQKRKVARVMHEYKHDELHSGSGGRVKNPRQAVAIALNEAGVSNRQRKAAPRAAAPDTETQDGAALSHAALMKQARQANIPGRSRMTHDQLLKALKKR